MRNLAYYLAALAFAGAVATGCSSSSSSGGEEDGGTDSPVTSHDSGNKPDGKTTTPEASTPDVTNIRETGGPDIGPVTEGGPEVGPTTEGGQKDTGADVAPGSCYFPTFVLGLITNDTTATALPSTDIGDNCTNTFDAGAFPASLFQ